MATSRGTSNGPDWADLASMIEAFEKQNRVSIDICFGSAKTMEMPDIEARAAAWEPGTDRRGAKPLALKSVKWRAERFRTMEGLLTYLLYQLDFLLAEHEWGTAESGENRSAAG